MADPTRGPGDEDRPATALVLERGGLRSRAKTLEDQLEDGGVERIGLGLSPDQHLDRQTVPKGTNSQRQLLRALLARPRGGPGTVAT